METNTEIKIPDGFVFPTLTLWNHLRKTALLSSSARNMLDVFVTFMREDDNLVSFYKNEMEVYVQYCEKILQLNYSCKTIRNAVSELCKADLLIKARNNIYYVNPLHFFKIGKNFNQKVMIEKIQQATGRILMNENGVEIPVKKFGDFDSGLNNQAPAEVENKF